jgi:DNA repair protein RadC
MDKKIKALLKKIEQYPELVDQLMVVAEGPQRGVTITSPEAAYAAVAPLLVGRDVEYLVAVALNGRRKAVATKVLSQGSDVFTVVCPRSIFRWALQQRNCHAIILAHNHPSGDPTPSQQDRDVTRKLLAAGRVIGIQLVDHIVVGAAAWCSLAELGEIPAPTADSAV